MPSTGGRARAGVLARWRAGVWRAARCAVAALAFAQLAPVAALANNAQTVNASELGDRYGMLLSSAPASCLSVPNGAYETKTNYHPGESGTWSGCEERGRAVVDAAAQVGQFADTAWSDLDHASWDDGGTTGANEVDSTSGGGTTYTFVTDAAADTNLGTSWVPDTCVGPYCGHLLKGDVKQYDENLDGKFDDEWIDHNNNGVIEQGEIDRIRSDQFSWGATSIALNQGELTAGNGVNLYPAGTRRMQVRLALGQTSTSPTAAAVCDGDMSNPACFDGVASPAPPDNEDPRYWAQCDPDRFKALYDVDPAAGQRALDNCLWFYSSRPQSPMLDEGWRTAPHPSVAGQPEWEDPLTITLPNDGVPFATAARDTSENQVVYGLMEHQIPDRQNMSISALMTYGFLGAGLATARYYNDWQIIQTDGDPNKLVNGVLDHPGVADSLFGNGALGEPAVGTAGPGSNRDTYDHFFSVQHSSLARGRGMTHDGGAVDECNPASPAYDPAAVCDGATNPTLDPFWGSQYVRNMLGEVLGNPDGSPVVDWNQRFDYRVIDGVATPCGKACQESGVGETAGLNFLTAQDVAGFFTSCLNCDSTLNGVNHAFTPLHPPDLVFMPYTNMWRDLPSISHGASGGNLSAYAAMPGDPGP